MGIGKLGFGTTALLALESASERQELLASAFDAGITHFDTAPYYGYGEAERILGRFIKGRRDQLTITTKFGIQPPRLAAGGSVAGAVKRLVGNVGPLKRILARQAGKMVQRGAFAVADAEKSLEGSLRSLQTDHIDILLLHEAGVSDTSGELLAFLERKQREGVIGRFGTGSEFAKVSSMAAERPAFADVLQFENSVVCQNRANLSGLDKPRLAITHGALGNSFHRLHAALKENKSLHVACSDALSADAGEARHLAAAMLLWAAQDNSRGIVLFSSSRPANVRSNMAALHGGRFASEQLQAFGKVVVGGLSGELPQNS